MNEQSKAPIGNSGAQTNVAFKPETEFGSGFFSGYNFSELSLNLEDLLKAGVHFGHQKARRHPSMDLFIFGARKGINIINLEKTAEQIKETAYFIEEIVGSGKQILFVGTKKQAHDVIVSIAEVCQSPYVVDRWLGGTFTNFKKIKERTKYLRDEEDKMEKGEFQKYTKFERMKKAEEIEKLEKKMGGIKYMNELPGAVFVIDVKEDNLAIQEAKHAGIPVIAISDSNVNISDVDYPIPGNDDALSSLKLILAYIGKAVLEAKKKVVPKPEIKPVVKV